MFGKLSSALILTTLGSIALADGPPDSQAITYAIENPLRPGAKAPHCQAQQPIIDGCTFHSVAGDTYDANLQVEPGEIWVASTPDPTVVDFQPIAKAQQKNGKFNQVIRITPRASVDADTTVTFDRLVGQPGSLRVVERRRINVMIHPA
ncbi:hypothetical protein Q6A49_00090 [Pseudomonas sp. 22-AL-CL-001]|uniref:hypothetical protein n=1 Tax=Pseudomonas alabamensis TaxID=3064349 RepID=UPI00271449DB|nr:hypothetical protein [Pseudomonas sp. 22-AL-CL-001]MDO7908948.1 hypothetical protein [Pseudomonas sp. 22-AL-CL-001]